MKARFSFLVALVISIFVVNAFAEQAEPERQRLRVVRTEMPTPSPTPVKTPSETVTGPSDDVADETPLKTSAATSALSFREIKSKIAEAKRSMQTRPIFTASAGSTAPVTGENVRVAFNDNATGQIDYVVIPKESFLSTKFEKFLISESGRQLRSRTIRGNGVNTPIELEDVNGVKLVPLLVQYPVVRKGQYIETAYYMSTHPGLVTPEVVAAGRLYVRNVIDIARDRLEEKGIKIQPKIADIAERLAAVEHVDHHRFRTEPHRVIYDDIYTLFALNEGQTYKYSVSSAGAGGMVQMIPSTYRMVRSWHPNVPLMPDFVAGMQNHVNASQAMLLYMQRTWNDLLLNPNVTTALATGIATQEQLMAAGYNSNPARLGGYIARGGAGWTNLIPRETKIYLQIYESIERHVPMAPRTK